MVADLDLSTRMNGFIPNWDTEGSIRQVSCSKDKVANASQPQILDQLFVHSISCTRLLRSQPQTIRITESRIQANILDYIRNLAKTYL